MKRIVLALAVVAALAVGSLAQAGAWGGSQFFLGQSVLGNDFSYATVYFNGGQYAEVAMDGYDVTELDLMVLDRFGNTVAIDDYYGDEGYVSFWVPYGQTYTIVVVNHGSCQLV
jgi:hypothetical protein